jgi:hypothetical protein
MRINIGIMLISLGVNENLPSGYAFTGKTPDFTIVYTSWMQWRVMAGGEAVQPLRRKRGAYHIPRPCSAYRIYGVESLTESRQRHYGKPRGPRATGLSFIGDWPVA